MRVVLEFVEFLFVEPVQELRLLELLGALWANKVCDLGACKAQVVDRDEPH